jgi:hypothetical protein
VLIQAVLAAAVAGEAAAAAGLETKPAKAVRKSKKQQEAIAAAAAVPDAAAPAGVEPSGKASQLQRTSVSSAELQSRCCCCRMCGSMWFN